MITSRFLLLAATLLGPALLASGAALATPAATHDYEFAGTLADGLGGPSLLALAGGTLGTAASPGFTFGANDGLQLAGVLSDTAPYSVEMLFDFSEADRYFKILDFQNRAGDPGLYSGRGAVTLYPRAAASSAQLQPATLADLILTRSALGMLTAYVDGVLSFSYDDSSTGITALTGNPLTFLADDAATGYREATSGFLRRIRIYDTVLSPADALTLASSPVAPAAPTSVPEPSSVLGLAAGLLAAASLAQRSVRARSVRGPSRAA